MVDHLPDLLDWNRCSWIYISHRHLSLWCFGGGIVMCRKGGKLPPPVIRERYQLEYGTKWLEMKGGSGTVVIVDDVLATGGTLQATNHLALQSGYDVI